MGHPVLENGKYENSDSAYFFCPFFLLLTLFSRVPARAMMGVNEGRTEERPSRSKGGRKAGLSVGKIFLEL